MEQLMVACSATAWASAMLQGAPGDDVGAGVDAVGSKGWRARWRRRSCQLAYDSRAVIGPRGHQRRQDPLSVSMT